MGEMIIKMMLMLLGVIILVAVTIIVIEGISVPDTSIKQSTDINIEAKIK